MTIVDYREHPEYHEGFLEAWEGVPLDENFHSPEYAAGWRSWFEVLEILDDM